MPKSIIWLTSTRLRILLLIVWVLVSLTNHVTAQDFRVEGAGMEASPTTYNGPCPGTINLRGKIQASAAGKVKYTYVYSDGGSGPEGYLDFEAAGVKYVETTWRLGGAGLTHFAGWAALRILSPNELESNHAEFVLDCKPDGTTPQPSPEKQPIPQDFPPDTPKVTPTPKEQSNELFENEKENYPLRDEWRKSFLQSYQDQEGQVRMDLLEKGMAHLEQMKVADEWRAERLGQKSQQFPEAVTREPAPDAPRDPKRPDQKGAVPDNKQVATQSALSNPTLDAPLSAQAPPEARGRWRQLGPAPLAVDRISDSGEVLGIAIDPRGPDDRVMYIATGQGGIWKTLDAGISWRPLTDQMPSLYTSAVALDPTQPDTVYAGTGNSFESNGQFTIKAVGLYKSTNGGGNWTVKGRSLFGPRTLPGRMHNSRNFDYGKFIYRILVPAHDVVLVATNQGLYLSKDGGENFGANSPGFNDGQPVLSGDVTDLSVSTSSLQGRIIYAAVSGVGIVQSTDSGATFPVNLFVNVDGVTRRGAPPAGSFGFISFAQSRRPDGRTFYASLGAANGGYLGLYKTSDGGSSWFKPSTDAESHTTCRDCYQGRYDHVVGVDPENPNRVYLGFVQLWFSNDGGVSFQGEGPNYAHSDKHVITFSKRRPGFDALLGFQPVPVYSGSDGGIYRSDDGGRNWTSLNNGLSLNLILQLSIGITDPRFVYSAIWDHGLATRRPDDPATRWTRSLNAFGDGTLIATDPSNAQKSYGAVMDGGIYRTENGGRDWESISLGLSASPDRLVYWPNRNSEARVESGQLVAGVGPRLFLVPEPGLLSGSPTLIGAFPSMINSMDRASFSPGTVWVGLTDGAVWRTNNLDSSGRIPRWNSFRPRLESLGTTDYQSVTVAVHPRVPRIACAVYEGFTGIDPADSTAHVFLTIDDGVHWYDISGVRGNSSGNLPDLPVLGVAFGLDRAVPAGAIVLPSIIIAMDGGVIETDADATFSRPSWHRLGRGLPNVRIRSLVINRDRNPPILRVGTWGRGVFELEATSSSSSSSTTLRP